MSTVNFTRPNDQTVRIIDQFYSVEIDVDANLYDIVLSFFKTVSGDTLAAKNFTYNLFQISKDSGLAVQEILDELRGLDQGQITARLLYYLNNFRSNSTLLGISATVTPNYYAARNIAV